MILFLIMKQKNIQHLQN